MRIVSLLPSATEIVAALGMGESLVGITHECDFPAGLEGLPRLTSNLLDPTLSSQAIDALVSASLKADAHTIYGLDAERLGLLEPDVILTQSLCEVCAVPTTMVEDAVCTMPAGAHIVSLDPLTLEGVFDSIVVVAAALEVPERGILLAEKLRERVEAVRTATSALAKPRVLAAEWLDPVYCGGHWVPGMIEAAGGLDAFGSPGKPSHPLPPADIQAADPEVVVLMPCGYDAREIASRYGEIAALPGWNEIRAVRRLDVFAVDASAFFSRPGPRLVEGVETLAAILHPGAWALPGGAEVLKVTEEGSFRAL